MRLFVAIELTEPVRAALAKLQSTLRPQCGGVRWVPPGNLHVTVKFLGEVPDQKVMGVTQAVERAASRASRFSMSVAQAGCFPLRGPVRIVWAGVQETPESLTRCVEAIEEEMEVLGFARERRPFSAHITIGRVANDRSGGVIREAVESSTFPPVEQEATAITLMSSTLSARGAEYAAASRAALAGV